MAAPPSLLPVRDIFVAMRTQRIDGHILSDIIGGGDPEVIASEVVRAIEKFAQLNPADSILDVGCGCGRIAAALSQYLDPDGRYTGVDIVPGLVGFGRDFITSRFPAFRFVLLDESNVTYDSLRQKGREGAITKLTESGLPHSFDLAISISLFTHLDYEPALEILASIHRMLKSDGRVFVTVFVLDADAADGIAQHRTGFSFKLRTPSGKLYAEKAEDPTFAVGYDTTTLDDLIRSAGFILERRVPGYWSSGELGEIFQDALVLRKAQVSSESQAAHNRVA